MRLALTQDYRGLRRPDAADPLRVLLSGCMAGWPCGVDGTAYDMAGAADHVVRRDNVRVFPFCPEDVGLGTPRTMPDLHGGDGRAALRGEARVLDEHGRDLSEGMIAGARAMLAFALRHRVELAILTDMSAACGSSVISLGCRFDHPRRFQQGLGVAAALLVDAGIPVVSQRDYRTLDRIKAILDPDHVPDPTALDHHEHPWTVETFGRTPPAI